jgi:predicted ArsR family transcriptional regulator
MARDRLSVVADPDLRAALLLARGRDGGFTADEAARELGVHRNVARARLDRLAAAGFLEIAFERRTGRSGPGAGRPAKVYSVAPEVEGVEFPPRRLAGLVGHLIDELPEAGRARALRRAGEDFGRELAESSRLRPLAGAKAGLERMCAALRSLGFQASLREVRDDVAVIDTPTCPLRPLVRERPEAVEIDHGMWAGLAESAVRDVRAEQVACDTAGCFEDHSSCSVVLRLRLEQRER